MKPILKIEEAYEVKIIEKINRFVINVEKNGKILKAHNTNTGRLKEYFVRGKRAFCMPHKGKKTDCRIFAVEEKEGFAVIDTSLQMKAFEEAYKKSLISWLSPFFWPKFKRNYKLGNSLIDYLFLGRNNEKLLLEVKSAVLRSKDYKYAMYPDCPTLRGRKHIKELIKYPRSILLFICALPRIKAFKPYCEGDPIICKLLKEAKERISIKAISIFYNPESRSLFLENDDLEIDLF